MYKVSKLLYQSSQYDNIIYKWHNCLSDLDNTKMKLEKIPVNQTGCRGSQELEIFAPRIP